VNECPKHGKHVGSDLRLDLGLDVKDLELDVKDLQLDLRLDLKDSRFASRLAPKGLRLDVRDLHTSLLLSSASSHLPQCQCRITTSLTQSVIRCHHEKIITNLEALHISWPS